MRCIQKKPHTSLGFDRWAEAGPDIVAKIIEFYIRSGFRRNLERISPVRRGEVIKFSWRIRTRVIRKQSGASILRSAWVCGLGLELTYQDQIAQQRAAELRWD